MKNSISLSLISLFLLCLIFTLPTQAQTSLGVRLEGGNLGFNKGLTLKHQFNDHHALEGLFTINKYDWRFTTLYEYHQPIVTEGLSAFVGGGMHFGKTRSNLLETVIGAIVGLSPNKAFIGIDGIAGLHYELPNAPINLSLDVRPGYNFGNELPKKFDIGGALSIRWSFGSGGGKGSGKGKGKGRGTGRYGNNNKGASQGQGPGTVRGTVKGRVGTGSSSGSSSTSRSKQSGSVGQNKSTTKSPTTTTSPSTSNGKRTGSINTNTRNRRQSSAQTGDGKRRGTISGNSGNTSNSGRVTTNPTKTKGKIQGKPTTKPVPNPKPKPKPKPRAETKPGGDQTGEDDGQGRRNQGESWEEEYP